MIPENVKEILKKQHYAIVGKHSAVQVCRWTKKSLRDEGVCYKEKFYGIKSHLCCQMSPAVMWCPNRCLHCWRAVEMTIDNELNGKIDSPKEIIDGCIEAQRRLLQGFNIDKNSKKKQLSRANQEKFSEAQEPMQFAISLSGEPTVYEKIGELIEELRKRGKTSFLVTNGLYPEKLEELEKKKQLPTQLYISVNTSNEELYKKFHRSSKKDAWERLNKSLEIMTRLRNKTRTIFRMNLILDMNMLPEHAEEYAELIKKTNPMFVEIKGVMSVGFARQRIPYNKMPYHKDIIEFSKKMLNFLPEYKILDEKKESRVVLLGKDKADMKIKKGEI
ncbi:tRNA-modifying enzyme [Candidatus Pacearchaeota archaeon RBG_19FT_COMBO_34_9]|nr:MAG: tRNA-modifying enzyme [Candidatus Pacearchaeota archaeon RBG_19FT_COMBO_34_9]OGJ16158.1 MAG: tRNA-modifying enzyme [Candidatus Pacearchaeota archaeon RBG_13_33_26]